jgi:hypothetical protein
MGRATEPRIESYSSTIDQSRSIIQINIKYPEPGDAAVVIPDEPATNAGVHVPAR